MNLATLLGVLLGGGGVGVVISAYFTYLSKSKETKEDAVNKLIENLQKEIKRVSERRDELENSILEKNEDITLKEEEIRRLNQEKHELELVVTKLKARLEESRNGSSTRSTL